MQHTHTHITYHQIVSHHFPPKNQGSTRQVPQPSCWITCCLKTFQEASRTFSRTSLLRKKVWEGVDSLTCSSVWLFGLLFFGQKYSHFVSLASCFGVRWTHEFCCIHLAFVWRLIVHTSPSPAPRCTWHSEGKSRILEHLMAKPKSLRKGSEVLHATRLCAFRSFQNVPWMYVIVPVGSTVAVYK